MDQPVISFKVQACAEARIHLTEDPFDNSGYSREIVIGGKNNTMSGVYGIGDTPLKEISTNRLLDCDELLDFWIRYKTAGMTIAVGKGQVDSGTFLEYQDPDPKPIRVVSISTNTNVLGEWQWRYDSGNSLFPSYYY